MHPPTLLTALLVLPLAAAATRAQDYTIKLKEFPDAGNSVTVTESGTTRSSFGLTLGEQVLKKEMKLEVEERQFTEKVLEGGGPRPRKFTRTYIKARKGEKDNPSKLSYEGKTVVFELQGDKYKASAEGVPDKDLKDLAKGAGKGGEMTKVLPKIAVKVGDTWAISNDAVAGLLGAATADLGDLTGANSQGKLTKAYKKDGQQWGTLDISLNVPLKKMGPLTLAKPMDFHFKIAIDTAIDGSSTAAQLKITATLKGRSEFEQNGQTFLMDLSIDGDFHGAHSAEK